MACYGGFLGKIHRRDAEGAEISITNGAKHGKGSEGEEISLSAVNLSVSGNEDLSRSVVVAVRCFRLVANVTPTNPR
jgi:hypothetical protein